MGQLKKRSAQIAIGAIAAAIQGMVPAQAATTPPPKAEVNVVALNQQHIGTVEFEKDGSFATSEVAPGRIELTFSGKRFESQARVEHYLLYRAAILTKQSGASWFGLLYLPGEAGPGSHPVRSSRPGQHDYGHWQPHWNYYVSGLGWQLWHPESGAAFWADSINIALVERYDAHAMIELGVGSRPQNDQPIFDVDEVIRDLEPAFR